MYKFIIQIASSLLLFTVLFFNLFVSKEGSTTLALLAVSAFLILSIAVNRFRKVRKRGADDAMLIITGLSILLVAAFYMIGMKSGFLISYNSIIKRYLPLSSWFKIVSIVILTELVRYVISQIPTKDNKQRWLIDGLMFLSFFLIDLTIVTKNYDYTNFNQLYEFIALVLVQSVAKNLLLNYVSRNYGYKPCLIYRVIIDLYAFVLPITPKLNMFIESVILLIFPYIIYLILKKIEGKTDKGPARKEKKHDRIISAISTIVFVILVALVSREFTYCMIAIGSESMTGTTNKGDAIVYKVYDEKKDNLKEDDIIIFKKNNVVIVHRIIKRYTVDGIDVYQTKGDFNESPDNWIVRQEDIIGKYKFKVVYIGWPSVWLSELF